MRTPQIPMSFVNPRFSSDLLEIMVSFNNEARAYYEWWEQYRDDFHLDEFDLDLRKKLYRQIQDAFGYTPTASAFLDPDDWAVTKKLYFSLVKEQVRRKE